MRKILFLFLLVAAFASCNNDRMKNNRDNRDNRDNYDNRDNKNDRNTNYGWARNEEDQFMNNCESTARKNVTPERAKEYCDCMLKKIKKIYNSPDEANRKMTQAEMQPLADECNGVR